MTTLFDAFVRQEGLVMWRASAWERGRRFHQGWKCNCPLPGILEGPGSSPECEESFHEILMGGARRSRPAAWTPRTAAPRSAARRRISREVTDRGHQVRRDPASGLRGRQRRLPLRHRQVRPELHGGHKEILRQQAARHQPTSTGFPRRECPVRGAQKEPMETRTCKADDVLRPFKRPSGRSVALRTLPGQARCS